MSAELKSNTSVERSSEKNFGITFSIIFFIFFLYLFTFDILKHKEISYFFLTLSIIFILLAFFYNKILYYPNLYWYKLGMLLSIIISPIIMFAVYLIAFVIFGLIIKITKGKLLNTNFESNKKTYWEIRSYELQDMKNQF